MALFIQLLFCRTNRIASALAAGEQDDRVAGYNRQHTQFNESVYTVRFVGCGSLLCNMFDTDKFIQCVQECPAIWEKASKEYSDRNEKEKSWRSVGEAMFDTWETMTEAEKQEQVKEMKNKWRHIRDSYSKYINQGVSGDPAPKKKKYVYADALSFLQQSIEKRRTTGSMPRVSDEEGEGEGDGDSSQEDPRDVEAATPQQLRPKQGTSAKGRKTPAAMTPFQTQLLSSLETAKSVEDDADRAYLLSLLPDYRQLNADEKLDFRLQNLQFFRAVNNKRKQHQQPTTSYQQATTSYQQPSTSYQHSQYQLPFQSNFAAIHQPEEYVHSLPRHFHVQTPAPPESQTPTPLPSPAPSSSHSAHSADFY